MFAQVARLFKAAGPGLAKLGKAVKFGNEVVPLTRNQVTQRFTREIANRGRFVIIATVRQGVSKTACAGLMLGSFLLGVRAKKMMDES